MEPMKLVNRNGYGHTRGLCCWDAERGSRKEATLISEYEVKGGYGNEPARDEEYARRWAKGAWELGSSRTARYRVAVSNGKETTVFTVKVSSEPRTEVEAGSQQTMVDLDTLSMEESK